MTYDDLPPLFRNTWAVYEAFRKLGFTDDDVQHVLTDAVPLVASVVVPNCLCVILKAQGKQFTVVMGQMDRPYEEAAKLLADFRQALLDKTFPEEDLKRMWQESKMGELQYFSDFTMALLQKGFVFPALAN